MKQDQILHFMFGNLGTNFKNSGEQDVKYTHKVIRHLKQEPAQIIYKQLGIDENLKLVAYVMDLTETYQMEEVN